MKVSYCVFISMLNIALGITSSSVGRIRCQSQQTLVLAEASVCTVVEVVPMAPLKTLATNRKAGDFSTFLIKDVKETTVLPPVTCLDKYAVAQSFCYHREGVHMSNKLFSYIAQIQIYKHMMQNMCIFTQIDMCVFSLISIYIYILMCKISCDIHYTSCISPQTKLFGKLTP